MNIFVEAYTHIHTDQPHRSLAVVQLLRPPQEHQLLPLPLLGDQQVVLVFGVGDSVCIDHARRMYHCHQKIVLSCSIGMSKVLQEEVADTRSFVVAAAAAAAGAAAASAASAGKPWSQT